MGNNCACCAASTEMDGPMGQGGEGKEEENDSFHPFLSKTLRHTHNGGDILVSSHGARQGASQPAMPMMPRA